MITIETTTANVDAAATEYWAVVERSTSERVSVSSKDEAFFCAAWMRKLGFGVYIEHVTVYDGELSAASVEIGAG